MSNLMISVLVAPGLRREVWKHDRRFVMFEHCGTRVTRRWFDAYEPALTAATEPGPSGRGASWASIIGEIAAVTP